MMSLNIKSLDEEVQNGECILIISGHGEVERCVSVAALHITRTDGLILVKLGTWDSTISETAKGDCRLPGTKQLTAEQPNVALQRMLETTLAPIRQLLETTLAP